MYTAHVLQSIQDAGFNLVVINHTFRNRFPLQFIVSHLRFPYLSCCRTTVGVGQRALSLSAHMAGGPPPPFLAPGRVTSPRQPIGVYYWDVAAAWNGWFLTI